MRDALPPFDAGALRYEGELEGKHLLVITQRYPSSLRESDGAFVREAVHAYARLGLTCSVVHTLPVSELGGRRPPPLVQHEAVDGGRAVRVLRPLAVTFSRRPIAWTNTFRLTVNAMERAVFRVLGELERPPDLVYGHFLYPSGGIALRIARQAGIPSVVAVGESSFWATEAMGYRRAGREYRSVDAVVANSSLNRRLVVERLGVPVERVAAIPNGVDTTLFSPRDRARARRRFGVPDDELLVAFVGAFNERKGPHRVLEAIAGLDGVGVAFAGDGGLSLRGPQVRHCGPLRHDEVPELLSAADLFVLPTLAEGSCNAIVEAMACGLPVVTSDGEFNDDLVDEGSAIRVDPMDIAAIRDAIRRLRDDRSLLDRMARNARARAEGSSIMERSARVLAWIASRTRRT